MPKIIAQQRMKSKRQMCDFKSSVEFVLGKITRLTCLTERPPERKNGPREDVLTLFASERFACVCLVKTLGDLGLPSDNICVLRISCSFYM